MTADTRPALGEATRRPVVSVVVPCRNAARYLPDLLESLAAQGVHEAWEVVLVDNDSADDLRSVAAAFEQRVPLRVVDARGRTNCAFARNAGARAAVGAKLLFVDADDVVAPGYVAAMSAALDRFDLVTSRVDSLSLNADWVRGAHGQPWQADHVGVFFNFLPAAGANIGVRTELFARLGGFLEECSGSEDIAFSWTAQLAGVDIHLVREAVYRYRYRHDLAGLFLQGVNWGCGTVRLYRRFGRLGMPARRLGAAALEWRDVLLGLLRSTGRSSRAPLIVRFGFCVGRLEGSLRYRVVYF